MAGNDNFTPPQTFGEAWRRAEKRQQRQERRTPGAAGAVVSNEGLAERVYQGSEQAASPSSAFALPTTDWAIDGQSGISHRQSFGSLVQWFLYVRRVGPPIPVSATGNIGNSKVAQLTEGWVPVIQQGAHTAATGRLASFVIYDTGAVNITAVAGTGDIATGELFTFTAFYIAANPVE